VGVEKNEKLAFEQYQKAAANYDHILANFSLGHCYQHGIGVTINHEKAFDFYKKSSDQGLLEGMYMVSYCYSHGIGVTKNAQDAHRFFQMAASHGVFGPFDVGRCFKPDYKTVFFNERNEGSEFLKLAQLQHENANYTEPDKFYEIIKTEYKDLDIDIELKDLLDNAGWEKNIKEDHYFSTKVIEAVALKEFNGDD
ncbi:12370_t:CDS:2, partial [Gigaspora rosea]